jgi:hypothetical protein
MYYSKHTYITLIPSVYIPNYLNVTQCISMTLPVTLHGGWAPLIDSACLRDSASEPARGLCAAYPLGVSP